MMTNVKLHDAAYNLLDRIEDLRAGGIPVSTENMRALGIEAEISDALIDCVIRFEAEMQTINQQCTSCGGSLCSCGLCHDTRTSCKDFSSQCGNDD